MAIQVAYFCGGKKGMERVSISLADSSESFTVRDLLGRVAQNGGPDLYETVSSSSHDESRQTLLIVLNGRSIQSLQGMDTPVHDGDSLSILPVVAGG
jgi:molybdopterin converting factor small subunit